MAHSTYTHMWMRTQSNLKDILELESVGTSIDITKDAAAFFRYQTNLYIKYIRIFRKLEIIQDQITHPQKWKVVDMLLEGVMGRILEVRKEMVDKGLSEFHFMDDVIQDLKLTPEEAAPQSSDEAVRIIQIAERARQGRLRSRIMRDIWREEQREKNRKLLPPVTMEPGDAATLIQKTWKGYNQRKQTIREREEEFEFIGMAPSEDFKKPVTDSGKMDARHVLQQQYMADYEKAQPIIKQTVMDTEGPDIKETYREQIRHWFIECYNTSGKFPDYPTVEQGGSSIIFAEKMPDQLLAEITEQELEKENQKSKKGNVVEAPKEEKKEKKGKQKSEAKPEGFSYFLPNIIEGNNIYTTMWKERDESSNLRQQYDVELEKEEKREAVAIEIRLQVDELMREELKNLRMAVERDFSEPPKAKPKPKKGKGKDKGAKKKEKDFTANRTVASLCDELIEQGVLKAVPQVALSSFLGDFSYLGSTLLSANISPMPSLYDIRQVVTMYAILPLGSQPLHEKAPLVKSILLAGPHGVGKKMLVHSICTETCATLFDLSAKNIAGKYPGKIGLQMLLHMVFKVAKLLQPSVVWIDDAEKTFLKKVPKEEKALEPKRLKKDLPKVLKQVKAEDRILLVGTSSRPFDAELKPLFKVYDRILLIPRADYASRYMIWKNLIERNGGIVTNALDLTSLAKISDGYTPGRLVQVVKSVLTEHRIHQQTKTPLTANNFLRALSKTEPIYQQEETALANWAAKTPLARKAQRARREKEALAAAAQEAASKKKR
ncbi:dynein regulatory complex protein 11-like isoform X2 [Scyliorhinus torazame]|uniref:dynein regulatory complex protein 11-like isoform X2 n=1 Tax=Scyliorhinus torazame TaxID=75743 RepID=UPI003B5BB1DF